MYVCVDYHYYNFRNHITKVCVTGGGLAKDTLWPVGMKQTTIRFLWGDAYGVYETNGQYFTKQETRQRRPLSNKRSDQV